MKNKSIWNEKIKNNNIDIPKNLNTDILIIGAGITGLSLAYELRDSNKKITIIDKSNIGMGITSKTTAKITYLQGIIYQTLRNNFDIKTSKDYLDSQIFAMNNIKNIVDKNNISCDLKEVSSIIFTIEKNNINKIKEEKDILESFNIKVNEVKDKKIEYGIKVDKTYTFNPLKYLDGLKNNIGNNTSIYENITAYKIKKEDNKYLVSTSKGTIKCNILVVACHYPFFLFPTLIPIKTYIKREYVNAAKVKNIKDYTAINIDKDLHSIRFYKDYLIYGSNQHKLTSKIDYEKNYIKSKKDFKKYFDIDPEYTWMNQDIMSNDSLPFIGEIDKNLYLATAYNAWGMTNSIVAAKVISDLIIKGDSKYKNLFDPNRRNVSLFANSIIGSFSYLKAYTVSLFKKNNPTYVNIKGIIYGVYIDKNNKKHIIKLLCPHMKCNLVFNNEEETWDCPCHGSRFDLDGKLIEGPSTKDINKNSE